MISALRITDPTRTCIPFWPKVEALVGREAIEFGPGVNVLIGPNGSGKSTILKAIARLLHAEQGSVPAVTQTSMDRIFKGWGSEPRVYLDGAAPEHDGQGIHFFDPDATVGTVGGQFDDDFFEEGLHRTLTKGSAGQLHEHRMMAALKCMLGKTPPPTVSWKVPRYESWADRWARVDATLAGTLPKGRPTVLLDEPERSMDLPFQFSLWRRYLLPGRVESQVIVATHSPVALETTDESVRFIELVPGYLSRCREAYGRP